MQFEGRTGLQRQDCSGVLSYDVDTQSYVLRINDSANLEFWLIVRIPKDTLEQVKQEEEEEDHDHAPYTLMY